MIVPTHMMATGSHRFLILLLVQHNNNYYNNLMWLIKKISCEISDSHWGEYEDESLLAYSAM